MNREPFSSSNIKAAGYDPVSKEMEVEFHSGAIYCYKEVPQAVYSSMRLSDSPGKFFASNVKNVYPCEKRS